MKQDSRDLDLRRFPWGRAFVVCFLLFVLMVSGGVAFHYWMRFANVQISLGAQIGMGIGVVLTLGLGVGLMRLSYHSARRGYDDAALYKPPSPNRSGED